MRIKKARQILKSLADDTRLRIINILKKGGLTVTEICAVLEKEQSNISKHLARLRLTEVVRDKRKGNNVYYFLEKPSNTAHKELINSITKGLADLETFKSDIKNMEKRKKVLAEKK
ncbi:MAG: metalloregulator ArsR/SmtB family transcription factor [Candidatus Omnitrophota bacterium]